MTGVGSTQGYIGKDFKNKVSEEGGDEGEEGEEEIEDMRNIFFRIKQENLHVPGGCREDSSV